MIYSLERYEKSYLKSRLSKKKLKIITVNIHLRIPYVGLQVKAGEK